MLPRLVAAGACDAAYAGAAASSEFLHARPWRLDGLGRAEMERRRDAWNAAVDAHGGGRDPLEVARAAKVDWHGGPLHARCGNPGCGAVEATPGAFARCARCVVAYCGRACQKAAWKPHHKAACGTAAGDPRLPSEVAVDRALRAECLRATDP